MNRIGNMIRSFESKSLCHDGIPIIEATNHCVIRSDCIVVTFTEWPDSDEVINMNVNVFDKSFNRFVDYDDIEDYALDMISGIPSLDCELVFPEVKKSIDHIMVNYDEFSTTKYDITSKVGDVARELIALLNCIGTDGSNINLTKALPFYDDIVGENVLKRIETIINDHTERDLDIISLNTISDEFIGMGVDITFDENHNSLIMDTPKGFFMFERELVL